MCFEGLKIFLCVFKTKLLCGLVAYSCYCIHCSVCTNTAELLCWNILGWHASSTCVFSQKMHTHARTRARLTPLCPGLPRWAGTRKVKPIWIILKQHTVSGSGMSWAICKYAPHSRQITTPPLSFLQAGCPSCRPTSSVKALKAQLSLNVVSATAVANVVWYSWQETYLVTSLSCGKLTTLHLVTVWSSRMLPPVSRSVIVLISASKVCL